MIAICLSLFSTAFAIAQTGTTYYGTDAGQNGDRNSNFGNMAGAVQVTAGDDNTFVGYSAGDRAFGDFNTSACAYSAYKLLCD